MALTAYHGSIGLRGQFIDNLSNIVKNDKWLSRPVYWNGETGSLIGSLLKSDDLEKWSNECGLPKWVALLIDTLATRSDDRNKATQWAVSLLETLEAGQKTNTLGSVCILAFLKEDPRSLINVHHDLLPAELITSLQEVITLHEKITSGEPVSNGDWRRSRNRAVSLTDSYGNDSVASKIGACIEAAAWDANVSRTAVSDTFRCWVEAKVTIAEAVYPWSKGDNEKTNQLLQQLHNDALAENKGKDEFIDVFALLEQKHPEWAVRMKEYSHFNREQTNLELQNAYQILHAAFCRADSAVIPLIPRADFFSSPKQAAMSISPDGQWLAWLASDKGVMNIWVSKRDHSESARQITFDSHRGVSHFDWTYLPNTLLYLQDKDGDENWQLYGVNLNNHEVTELLPVKKGARVGIHRLSCERRHEIVVSSNERDARYSDLYVLNLLSGEVSLLQENTGFSGFIVDSQFQVQFATRPCAQGGFELLRMTNGGIWNEWITFDYEDSRSSGPSHLSADGKTLYLYDSRGRDTAALVAIELQSGEKLTLAADDRADISDVLTDRHDYRPLAYIVNYDKPQRYILDSSIQPDISFLDNADIGLWRLSGRTEDDKLWIITAADDTRPGSTFLFHRETQTLRRLFDIRPKLSQVTLARMQPVVIKSRDGLDMVAYISVPPDIDAGACSARYPVPMIVLVHGGPWSRDNFGYNAMHQWLANRGYAVLSVNYRGSTGFGKAFINAADGEWGGKMDDDLIDAVKWAINQGIADPERIGIFGGSYGGFATLSGLTRFPELYACGIDVVGPSCLETLLESIPPYWEAERDMQYRAIGDPRTDEGRACLRARSPLFRASEIKAPLLIAQGANDPRVNQHEAEQMVSALKNSDIPVIYALYKDEGHGFVREPNRMSFNALCESFLAKHLGGREESWDLADFPCHSLLLSGDVTSDASE